MTSLVRNNVKGRVYIYESESYRDEKNYPRCNRALVGKINVLSGISEFKDEYIRKLIDSVGSGKFNPNSWLAVSGLDLVSLGQGMVVSSLGLKAAAREMESLCDAKKTAPKDSLLRLGERIKASSRGLQMSGKGLTLFGKEVASSDRPDTLAGLGLKDLGNGLISSGKEFSALGKGMMEYAKSTYTSSVQEISDSPVEIASLVKGLEKSGKELITSGKVLVTSGKGLVTSGKGLMVSGKEIESSVEELSFYEKGYTEYLKRLLIAGQGLMTSGQGLYLSSQQLLSPGPEGKITSDKRLLVLSTELKSSANIITASGKSLIRLGRFVETTEPVPAAPETDLETPSGSLVLQSFYLKQADQTTNMKGCKIQNTADLEAKWLEGSLLPGLNANATVSGTITISTTAGESFAKSYGGFYLFHKIGVQSGLLEILKTTIPNHYKEIYSLATYFISNNKASMYLEHWREKNMTMDCKKLTSQRISELLRKITPSDRDRFYRLWNESKREDEHFAMDVTSISSWSELTSEVEYGRSKDNSKLPQVNLCLLVGHRSGLPMYQTVYNGSINDHKAYQNMVNLMRMKCGETKTSLVMDKGFYSKKNIDDMISNGSGFIIGMPFTVKLADDFVKNESQRIFRPRNAILTGKEVTHGVTSKFEWNKGQSLYAHTFFNNTKSINKYNDIIKIGLDVKKQAEKRPDDPDLADDIENYLEVTNLPDGGKSFCLRDSLFEKKDLHAGWFVILSDKVDNTEETLRIYRKKDVVEKTFWRSKDFHQMGRARISGTDALQGKLFIGFISMILSSCLNNLMVDNNLYKKYTMQELIMTLDKQILNISGDQQVLNALTKEQEELYKTLGFTLPLV